MRFIAKYGHFCFMLVAILMVYIYSPIKGYESSINITLMGVGVILSLVYVKIFFSIKYVQIFKVVYGILLLNVIYQLTLGWLSIKTEDWLYLLAKYGTSAILIISIVKEPKFYIHDAYKLLGYILAILLLIGGLSAEEDQLTRRYSFGFGNANWAGAIGAFTFAVFLIKTDIKQIFRWGGILISLVAVMVCGSRAGLVLIVMALIFKYKINFQLIGGGILFLILILWGVPKLGFEIHTIDRIAETIDPETGELKTNREREHEAGLLMFYNKFWTGYGLSAYKIIDESVLPDDLQGEEVLGTHNGYICAAKTYGIFGWLIFIGIIFFRSFYLFRKFFKSKDPDICLHLFVVCSVLVVTMGEDFLIGINAIITILFLTSVSVLEYIDLFSKTKRRKNSVL